MATEIRTRLWSWATMRGRSFNLLPVYFGQIRANWIDIFFGASPPFFVYGLWWLFATPPMLVTVFAVGWAFLIAGYYAWREDHARLEPKVVLQFSHREPFIQTTPSQIISPRQGLVGPGPDRVFIRVFPSSSVTVSGCRAYLLAVYKEEGDNWIPTPLNEACLLTWANLGAGPLAVEPLIGPYIDVCYIENGNEYINPCIPAQVRPLRIADAFHRLGTYRFDIQVTNANCLPIALRIQPGASWDDPKVEVIEPYPNGNSN